MRKHFLILMLFALLPFTVWAADLKDMEVIATNVYYGATVNPTVTVTGLTEGTEFEVYKEDSKFVFFSDANCTTAVKVANVNATVTQLVLGEYYVKVVGKSEGYAGTWNSAKFQVNPRPLSDAAVTIAAISGTFNYNGSAHTPGIAANAVKFNGVNMTPTTDYTYEYSDNINAGQGKVIFTGHGNFTGTVTKEFTINPKDLPSYSTTAYKITKADSYTYNGQKQGPTFQVFDGTTDITEYVDVKWFTTEPTAATAATAAVDNIDYGTYYAKLFGKGNYSGYAFKNDVWTFSIAKRNGQIIIEKDSKVYDGVTVTNDDLDQTKIIYVNFAAADGQAMATNFNNEVYLEFATAGGKKDAGTYTVVAKLASGATSSIARNYNITWETGATPTPAITGEYKITKRPVTVTLEDIHMTRGDAKLTAASGKTGAAQNLDVDPKADEDDTDYNVVIVAATATSESGFISTESVNDFKTGLTLKLLKSEAGYAAATEYPNAIELSWNNTSTNAVAKNYVVNAATAIKGKLIVDKEKLMVYVKNVTKEYGYTINQDDFDYYAGAKLKKTPTYKIYDSDNNEVTADDQLEAGKTYTITIDTSNLAELTPDNYTLTEDCIVPNFLNITKKKLYVTVNDLKLNVGFPKDDLKDYASLKPYTVAFDEEPTFEFSWGDGTGTTGTVYFDTNNKLEIGASGNEINNAIVVELVDVAEGELGYNPVNANYELVPTYGKLNILAADVLILSANDENMCNKLAAAAGNNRDVTLQGRAVLKREVWAGMVLPFETSVKEISDALNYAVVDILDENNTTNDMHLKLHMGKINANQPFIVKYYKEDEVVTYTATEANNYNAGLDGAWTALTEKTAAVPAVYTAVTDGTTLTSGTTYYTSNTGDGAFVSNGTEVADGTNYFALTAPAEPATYYSEGERNAHNATLPGAKHEGDVKAVIDNSELDLADVTFTNKPIVYAANAAYVNEDGNVFVQNKNNGHQFIGTYNPVKVYGAEYKWISRTSGALVDAAKYTEDNKAPLGRLISYFKLNNPTNARILIDEPDGTTTVIDPITVESMNVQAEGWYTLNGVKLQGVPTQKGIYINNGKKIVIK